MKFKATAGLLGCLFLLAQEGFATSLVSYSGGNPYTVISERNVFHLNPIPPPAPAPEPPKADLPTIKLSGFIKIGKNTHALFSSVPKDKKEEPMYFNLADGQKEGILEVVKIDEEKGEVEIVNSGTPTTLTLKNDSLETKTPASKKTAQAENKDLRRRRVSGTPVQFPERSGFRFPTSAQSASPVGPSFDMPNRRSRL